MQNCREVKHIDDLLHGDYNLQQKVRYLRSVISDAESDTKFIDNDLELLYKYQSKLSEKKELGSDYPADIKNIKIFIDFDNKIPRKEEPKDIIEDFKNSIVIHYNQTSNEVTGTSNDCATISQISDNARESYYYQSEKVLQSVEPILSINEMPNIFTIHNTHEGSLI